MELLQEIYELDLGLSMRDSSASRNGNPFWMRRSVRCIVFNEKYEMALLHMKHDGYYKLPGGGIESKESIEAALHREVMEEVGVNIEIMDEIGMVVEYRDEHELLQFSYGYVAQITGDMKEQQLTEEEISSGLSVQWISLNAAIERMESIDPISYVGKFIQARDLSFMKQLQR